LKDNIPVLSGVPSLFIKKFNSTIKNLTYIGNQILNNGIAPSKMNKGLITMLPKGGKNPSIVSNTRGITLLEIDRKLCTSVMTRRLNQVFEKFQIISSNQTC
jgi:hypothetical protein